ncbi:MAG: hypothetical protein KME21_20395 [Desmonostoc vinosum HA7617-LM4]|nr:hypothetical protein [Desmonostoc vinosum HA7617-LM4]
MGRFFRFRVLVDAGTRGRGDAGTRRVPITKARGFKQGKHFLPPRL